MSGAIGDGEGGRQALLEERETGRRERTIRHHPASCQNLGGEVSQCVCRWDEGWGRVEVGVMRLDPAHL